MKLEGESTHLDHIGELICPGLCIADAVDLEYMDLDPILIQSVSVQGISTRNISLENSSRC